MGIVITGYAEGSLIVMYTVTVDEKSSLTAPEVNEDIKSAIARNQDSDLVVSPSSLSVTGGKFCCYTAKLQLHQSTGRYSDYIVIRQ